MFQPCTPSRPFPTVDAGFPSGYLRKCRVFPCFTTSSGASPPPMKKKTHHASFFFFLTARKARGNDFFKSGQNADAAILYLEAARYLPARVTEELPDSKDLLGSLHSNTAAAQATLFLFCFFILFFFWGGGVGGGGCSQNSNTPAAQALLSMRSCFVYTFMEGVPTFRWCQPHRHTALLISAILACTHLFFLLSTRPRVCFTGAAGEVARIGRIGGRGVAHRLGESEGAIPSRRRAAQAQRL